MIKRLKKYFNLCLLAIQSVFAITLAHGIMSIFEHFRAPLLIMTALRYKKVWTTSHFFVLRMNLLWQHLLLPRHFNYQDNAMTIFHHFKASVEKGKLIVMKRLLIWNHKYEIARNDIKLQQSFATTKTCYMKLEIMKPVPFWSTYQVQ